MKPLCIDLFCGLGLLVEPELFRRADAFVEQLVTGGAKNPDHVRAAVLHFPTLAIASEFRTVREFNNSAFTAGLASAWNFRVTATESNNQASVFEFPTRIVNLLHSWVFAVKRAALFTTGLLSTLTGAVAAVCGRRRYVEMPSAYPAVSTRFGDIGLFMASDSSYPRLAAIRAVALIRALCGELGAAA